MMTRLKATSRVLYPTVPVEIKTQNILDLLLFKKDQVERKCKMCVCNRGHTDRQTDTAFYSLGYKSIFDKNFTGITVGEAVAGFESSSANCSGYVETIAVGQSEDTVDLGKYV